MTNRPFSGGWHVGPLCLFDVESTGVDPHRDRIISAAVIIVGPHGIQSTTEVLINPGIPIPEQATAIHGITTEHARVHGTSREKGIGQILDGLKRAVRQGMPIVGHNVTYDLTMLAAEAHRAFGPAVGEHVKALTPVVDTMVLDRWVDPYRPKEPTKRRQERCGSRRLVDTCRVHGVHLDEQDAHGATADALAAGRLAYKMAAATPGLRSLRLDALHALQIDLKREQAEAFGAWLVKQGKPDDVSREWPIQSPPPGWAPEELPNHEVREQVSA